MLLALLALLTLFAAGILVGIGLEEVRHGTG